MEAATEKDVATIGALEKLTGELTKEKEKYKAELDAIHGIVKVERGTQFPLVDYFPFLTDPVDGRIPDTNIKKSVSDIPEAPENLEN